MNNSSANVKRLQRRLQEWGVCHAGISISEGDSARKDVLQVRSTQRFAEIVKKASITSVPEELMCEVPTLEEWDQCIKQTIKWSNTDRNGKACDHKVIMKCLYVFIKMYLRKQ